MALPCWLIGSCNEEPRQLSRKTLGREKLVETVDLIDCMPRLRTLESGIVSCHERSWSLWARKRGDWPSGGGGGGGAFWVLAGGDAELGAGDIEGMSGHLAGTTMVWLHCGICTAQYTVLWEHKGTCAAAWQFSRVFCCPRRGI